MDYDGKAMIFLDTGSTFIMDFLPLCFLRLGEASHSGPGIGVPWLMARPFFFPRLAFAKDVKAH